MRKKIKVSHLFCISMLFLAALGMRLIEINSPVVEMQYWRQAETATMSRNFYEEKMNILYPSINWRGDTKGYVESEFPLYAYGVAVMYKLTGKPDACTGRIIAVIFSVLTIGVIYAFSQAIFDSKTAVYAAAFYAFSPISVFYSRAFMPESMLLFFYVATVYLFFKWTEQQKFFFWLLASIAAMVTFLMKPTTLFLVFPIFGIVWDRHGKGAWRRRDFWYFVLLSILPSVFWYYHAYNLFSQTGLSFGILSGHGYDKFATVSLICSIGFWRQMFFRFCTTLLTPAGGTLFFIGFLMSFFDREILKARRFLIVWIFAFFVYFFLIAEGNRLLEYYQLFLIPVAGILIARFLVVFEKNWGFRKGRLFSFIVFCMIFLTSVFVLSDYLKPRDFCLRSLNFARQIEAISSNDDLFIVVDTEGDYDREWYEKMQNRIHSPNMLYYLNRKGWELLPHEIGMMSPEDFQLFIEKGAKYLTIPKKVLKENPGISFFLEKFRKIEEDSSFNLYKLA